MKSVTRGSLLTFSQTALLAVSVSMSVNTELTELNASDELTLSSEDLYQLTTDISLVISQVYDQMLSDMTESLYQPLPKIAFN